MRAAVLDACVLANFSLCDTLLRLPEAPRLFEPKWSDEILSETTRTLEGKLGWPRSLVTFFEAELRANFGEAWIRGHETLVDRMPNSPEDRHVLAAAVHAGASRIVTFNLRHFKPQDLAPWPVRAAHPETFLIELLNEEPEVVRAKLRQQAVDRRRSPDDLLEILQSTVPAFARQVRGASK